MEKLVNISSGVGTSELVNDNYEVMIQANGYENTTINPNNVSVSDELNEYNFTISANGVLTLHVIEEGNDNNIPIVGATFIRTDINGNEYGFVISTNENGDAVFNNVPYSTTDAPIIYFKQLSSDGDHEYNKEVQNTFMICSTSTIEVTNKIGELRTIHLTDKNYSGLPICDATISLKK